MGYPSKLILAGSYNAFEPSESEKKLIEHSDKWARIGLGLLIFGFVLQLVSTLLPSDHSGAQTAITTTNAPANPPSTRQTN